MYVLNDSFYFVEAHSKKSTRIKILKVLPKANRGHALRQGKI